MNPIIRWAGSKRQLLPKLRPFWPGGDTRYIEPFCGSACLFFDLQPKRAVLGDLNSELITTYKALREDSNLILDFLREWPTDRASYDALRSHSPDDLTEVERAARFLYLNKHCFNGIYRTNRRGQFNVPKGRTAHRGKFDYEGVRHAADLLNRATLVNGDFILTLQQVERGDFVYIDPPYAVSGRKIFAEYHPNAFTICDLARLGRALFEIHNRGAIFVVSYADSPEARQLLKPWGIKRVRTRRNVAGFVNKRRHAFEVIASNLEEIAYAQ